MGCGSSSNSSKVGAQNTETANQEESEKAGQNIARQPSINRSNSNVGLEDEDGYSVIRLLLLGAAESGKTTLLEQIRLLYNQNWTEAEMFHSKAFIYNNILQNIRILIEGVKKSGEKLTNPENEPRAESLLNNDESRYARFPESMANDIKSIWNDPSIQEIYAKRSTMNLNDSAKYFLDNLDNINKEDYVPSPKDLIMSYVPTVGVQNVIFTCNNRAFQLFDIGGQKIDRRKWATMYDGIDAIFFCLAISEYNQTMYEDPNMNRLIDSLSLLQKISDEPKFKETPIFLFLNEVDVFKEKLNIFPLENYCLNYSGKSEEDALNYMESLAKQATIGRSMGLIYIYRCCCIDTNQMSKILKDIFKIILKKNA